MISHLPGLPTTTTLTPPHNLHYLHSIYTTLRPIYVRKKEKFTPGFTFKVLRSGTSSFNGANGPFVMVNVPYQTGPIGPP